MKRSSGFFRQGHFWFLVRADFLCESCQQEVGCLLNQAEVNMPSEEKGGNIPEIEGAVCAREFSQMKRIQTCSHVRKLT